MKKSEFNQQVANFKNEIEIVPSPLSAEELKMRGCTNPLIYGRWCEYNMEKNLFRIKREYTFTSDLSIAEWFLPIEGIEATFDTIKRCLELCYDDFKAFGELVVTVNLKAWEHAARKNESWSKWYSEMYYLLKDLYFEHFTGNEEAIDYYFEYVD